MDDQSATASGNSTATSSTFTCARCGIVSSERTCFHFPVPHSPGPRDIRCVTCQREWQRRRLPRQAISAGLSLAVFVGALLHSAIHSAGQMLLTWVACVLLLPIVIALHEAGHFVVARLMGMEIGAVAIGVGAKLWDGEIWGIPVQVNLLPLFGYVSLGLPAGAFARLRLWIATLAGPATNVGAMWLSAHYWTSLDALVGEVAPTLWIILNALIGFGNLIPYAGHREGRPFRSDGLALVKIPGESAKTLRRYVASAPLMRAFQRYQRRNYTSAQADCLVALARDPDSDFARCLLSSCQGRLSLFNECREAVMPVLERSAVPILVAWSKGNIALAILMSGDLQSKSIADRLSKEAYEAFPCLLSYRTSRALVLTWNGDPLTALSILEYGHYQTARPPESGQYAAAKALALRVLGRAREADSQMAVACALKTEQLDLLESVIMTDNAPRPAQ
jgi:hypothetical protein